MSISLIGSIIALTAYFCLSCLFFWIAHIPNANRSTTFWGWATVCTFMARASFLLPASLGLSEHIEAIYTFFIVFEKAFLGIGIVRFLKIEHRQTTPLKIFLAALVLSCFFILMLEIAALETFFAIIFATFNSAVLAAIGLLLLKHEQEFFASWVKWLIAITFIFALHWLTYPLARIFEAWLAYGLIFGTLLNLMLYLTLAVVALISLQDRLLQAEQEARLKAQEAIESNKAKSEFLANMSHEIRTPLNGVLGILQVLKKTTLDKEQVRKIDIANDSGISLLNVINDILDFSKIEADKLSLENTEFNLRDLVENTVLAMHRPKGSKVALVLDVLSLNSTKVIGDPHRLRQVIVNILSNALKFTHEGEVIVKASSQRRDRQTVLFTCTVCDTGIGIGDQESHRLFQAFTQGDASTTRQYGGTGLGLAISQRLCDLMGGSIHMESHRGKGSRFSIELPMTCTEDDATLVPSSLLSDCKVLIVESNSTNRELITRLATQGGGDVIAAANPKDAVALSEYRHCFFDVALLETGISADELMFSNPPLISQATSIIWLCDRSCASPEHELESLSSVKMYKPIILNEVFDTLRTALASESPSPATTAPPDDALAAEGENMDSTNNDASLTVLLVEDNEINRALAEMMFEDIGIQCETAQHGEDAIAKLNSQQNNFFQVILMDCQMPVMDGYVCTEKIRRGDAGDHYKSIPIIALTANAMADDKEKCFLAGMNDYITKPFDGDILKDKIQRWGSPKTL